MHSYTGRDIDTATVDAKVVAQKEAPLKICEEDVV